MVRQIILRYSYLLLIIALLFSCESKKDLTENPEEFYAGYLPGSNSEDWTLGGKAFGIFHEVKDYSSWKTVFDEDLPRREEAHFEFLDILESVDNENYLAVFFRTPDHKSAKTFISDDLRQKMSEAGVVSVPSFIMYDLVFMSTRNFSSIPYRVGASYKVKNFDSWLSKFTADRTIRSEMGLLDIGVARSPESPRIVYIMMAVEDPEAGRAFIEKENQPEKLSAYGVVGDPTFNLWKRAVQ